MDRKQDELPTYEQALKEHPTPPAYKAPLAGTPMAAITNVRRENAVYDDLDTVVDSTQFDDVDEFDYEQLSEVVRDVSLDAGKEWMS